MPNPGPGLRKRVVLLLFLNALMLLILAGRVFWIQVIRGDELRAAAQGVRTRHIPVEAKRGVIYDTRGRELAISITSDTVVVNPSEIVNPEVTAAKLAAALNMPAERVLKILQKRTSFEYVKRKIDEKMADAVRDLNLPGVYLTQETRRVYPKGGLAANILGFAGTDSQGLEGLEMVYDKELRGKPGSIVIEYDARNREIPQAVHRYIPPRDGLHLQLTIDETIQYIVERELEKAMLRTQAKAAWVIVMNPKNGEILALAQRPSYNPNLTTEYLVQGNPDGKKDADPRLWRNLAISDAYPPGSVFKPITGAMAVEEGKVAPETGFYDTGAFQVPGSVVRNWDGSGLGSTNFAEAFKLSANTIFAQVGLRVGLERFYHYLEKFGLTGPTGIDLPGEGSGIRPPLSRAKPLDLALMSFGQTLTVTPIQMISATAVIANGGYRVKPHVAKAFLDSEGRVVRSFSGGEGERVISEATARTIRRLMGTVVDEGTGKNASIPGYAIGGKTGTSQKVIGGRVTSDKHIASFIGFAPLDDPQVLTYVMVDEPQGMYYGGVVAAPVFEAVMRDVLPYLGIKPAPGSGADGEEPAVPPEEERRRQGVPEGMAVVPDLVNLPVAAASEEAAQAGLRFEASGSGLQVVRQVPPAGALLAEGGLVIGYTDAGQAETSERLVTVPDLSGRTMRQAARLLGSLGLRLEAVGSGVAIRQSPEAGTKVPGGSSVHVIFAPPPGPGGPTPQEPGPGSGSGMAPPGSESGTTAPAE